VLLLNKLNKLKN